MDAKQLFEAGDLAAAIAAVTQEVKARPADAAPRTFLFELLCFAGELDRAEKQLEVVGHQDVQAEWAVQVYRNLLAAERARRALYAEGRKPEFLLDPPDYIHLHLDAINRLREQRGAEASELLDKSAEAQPALSGQLDGRAFDEFRDCDDLLAPILELFFVRDYVWLPLEQIREIEISAPERPRDLLWIPARVVLRDDSQRRGYLPTLYHGSHQHSDQQVKLGRMTDWASQPEGPMLGVGLRTFLAGEDAIGLLECRNIQFA